MEKDKPNGHEMEVSPLKRVLLRTIPELKAELDPVVNVFDPWARDRGEYYSLQWKPRPGAERTLLSKETKSQKCVKFDDSDPLAITSLREYDIGRFLADHVNRADDKKSRDARKHRSVHHAQSLRPMHAKIAA